MNQLAAEQLLITVEVCESCSVQKTASLICIVIVSPLLCRSLECEAACKAARGRESSENNEARAAFTSLAPRAESLRKEDTTLGDLLDALNDVGRRVTTIRCDKTAPIYEST